MSAAKHLPEEKRLARLVSEKVLAALLDAAVQVVSRAVCHAPPGALRTDTLHPALGCHVGAAGGIGLGGEACERLSHQSLYIAKVFTAPHRAQANAVSLPPVRPLPPKEP